MNIIFYTYPEGTNKVAFTLSDKSVDYLREIDVIPPTSFTLIKPYDPNAKAEEKAKLSHVDKLRWNYDKTDVEFDLELLAMDFLRFYREIRENIFKTLDQYQTRALIRNKTDLINMIEEDKKSLREFTEHLNSNYKTARCAMDLVNAIPYPLTVDYDEKYKEIFKSENI